MRDIAVQWTTLEVEMSEYFFMHFILDSFPGNSIDLPKSLTALIKKNGQLMNS